MPAFAGWVLVSDARQRSLGVGSPKPLCRAGSSLSGPRSHDRAKLSDWTFRSLRHFFITELCRRGAPTVVVKQLAGQAELSTTQRYAHTVASDLGAAIALFSKCSV